MKYTDTCVFQMFIVLTITYTTSAVSVPHYRWARYAPHVGVVSTPHGYSQDYSGMSHYSRPMRRAPYSYSYSYNYPTYPVVTPSGYLQDTPEVAAAKVAHFAEYARAAAAAAGAPLPPNHPYYYPFSLPGAPYVTPQGYLADTPEVAAAKLAHFAEHARALLRNG